MDPFTLHMASALTNVSCSLVLATAWAIHRDQHHFGYWAAAFAFFANGLLLATAEARYPVLGALAFGSFLTGVLTVLAGFRRFDGLPSVTPAMLGSAPVPTLLYLGLLVWAPDGGWPKFAAVVATSLLAAQGPWYILRANPEGLVFRRIAGVSMAFPASVSLLMVLWAPAFMTLDDVGVVISLADLVCSAGVLAGFLGMVVERDNRRLDRAAREDPLTGCLNRAGLAACEAARSGAAGLLVIDLDHFKALNDRHGHAAGDEALREFVRRARTCLPAGAAIARSGGEEFVAVLPRADGARILDAAARIGSAVRERPLEWDGAAIPFTVSVGVARLGESERLQDGIRRADAALYRAKAAGRDRLAVAEPESAPAATPPLPAALLPAAAA